VRFPKPVKTTQSRPIDDNLRGSKAPNGVNCQGVPQIVAPYDVKTGPGEAAGPFFWLGRAPNGPGAVELVFRSGRRSKQITRIQAANCHPLVQFGSSDAFLTARQT